MLKFTKTGFKKMFSEIQKITLQNLNPIRIDSKICETYFKDYPEYLSKVNINHPDVLSNLKDKNNKKQVPSIRLLKSTEQISEKRKEKNLIYPIGLKSFLVCGDNTYSSIPDDFNLYVKDSNLMEEYKNKIKSFSEIFSKFNMENTANSITKKISSFDLEGQNYLGFKRMSPMLAASTLALTYNFKFVSHYISVPQKFFKKSYWAVNKEEIKSKFLTNIDPNEVNSFSYEARIYPLDKTNQSKVCEELVGKCDTLINNAPAFDSYWVVKPSIDISCKTFYNGNVFSIRDSDTNQILTFKEKEEASNMLIELFERDKLFNNVLLGERDGKCYFISLI